MSPRRIGSVLFQALSSAACLIAALGGVRLAPHAGRGAAKYRPAKGCMSRGRCFPAREGRRGPSHLRAQERAFFSVCWQGRGVFLRTFFLFPFLLPESKGMEQRAAAFLCRFSRRRSEQKNRPSGKAREVAFGASRRCLGRYSLPCEKRVIISMVREAESGQGGIWARSTHTASASSAVSRRMSSGPSSSAT